MVKRLYIDFIRSQFLLLFFFSVFVSILMKDLLVILFYIQVIFVVLHEIILLRYFIPAENINVFDSGTH